MFIYELWWGQGTIVVNYPHKINIAIINIIIIRAKDNTWLVVALFHTVSY